MKINDERRVRRRAMSARMVPLDVLRFGRSLAGPRMDTRTWFAAGTVGLRNEEGEFITTDPECVFVEPKGAIVSVRLEPEGEIITARWNGVSVGRFGRILFPLRGGDEVVVAFPGGDLNSPAAVVLGLQSNTTATVPEDWANDRVLFDLNVPMEIRGPAVSIRSANLQLNGRPVVFSPGSI